MTHKSIIHDLLQSSGANFIQRDDQEIAGSFQKIANEYATLRNTVGLTDHSHILMYRFPDEDAIYFLDDLLPANIANIRFGRIIHTFLSDDQGNLLSDVYVAHNDEEIIVLFENCTNTHEIELLLSQSPNPRDDIENLTEKSAVFSIDGPQSWAVMKNLFSADILGMPYLSVEPHETGDIPVTIMRVGKTGEFGYLIMVDRENSEQLWTLLKTETEKNKGNICGLDVFDHLKLDGRFFNINQEGRIVKDPLALGLQWMIDFEKETFSGRDAILARREAGLTQKIIGIQTCEPNQDMALGQPVLIDGSEAGQIVTAKYSWSLDRGMALALLDTDLAYSRVPCVITTESGPVNAVTVSMPPFIPNSLNIKLDEI